MFSDITDKMSYLKGVHDCFAGERAELTDNEDYLQGYGDAYEFEEILANRGDYDLDLSHATSANDLDHLR